ncbi:MAG TPA: GGDEF domain-containing protein [Candidatus Limnocylindrales bacterium]|nr:GGDEF domain-containing protein [Candidatus Limnocylindrales bacterium]
MPVEPVLTLIVLAVVANLALMAFIAWPGMVRRRRSDPADSHPGVTERGILDSSLSALQDAGVLEDGVPRQTYDRVVRIVSWVFILGTAAIVGATGLWPDTQPAILVLLGLAGLVVLLVHDLLPSDALGSAKFVVEGSVAITFATLLVLLTGQTGSPYFFVFPLIVAGAALVVSPAVTIALAGIASVGYVAAVIIPTGRPATLPPEPVVVGLNLTALLLLAYVAMVVAREQRRSRDAAIRLSTIDPLTGLFNRTFFFAAVDREIARSLRSGRGFCLLMMDLDELKAVNDRHGHFHGDRLLRAVGDVVRMGVRRIDTPARYGGDEFVVLCPETDPTGAFVLAEKIRQGVRELDLDSQGTRIDASVSLGVVSFPDDGRTSDDLLIAADQAMYASKRLGKDRVSTTANPSLQIVRDADRVAAGGGRHGGSGAKSV